MAGLFALALDLLLVGAGVVALWYGALLLVENATLLARRVGLSEVVVGVLVVGLGTSAPELAVTVDAALVGAADVAAGNVVGSNFVNLGLVLGGVALVRALPVRGRLVRRDGAVLLVATVLALVFLRDRALTRPEAGVLVAGLLAYLVVLVRQSDPDQSLRDVADPGPGTVARLLVGFGLVLGGADVLVRSAVDLARVAGVSEWAVGLTVIALGTSTPEFAASLVAARRNQHGLATGNLLGSSSFNLLGVLGVAGLVQPLSVTPDAPASLVWLVVLVALVVGLLWTDRELSRPEGALLVAVSLARLGLDLFG